MSDPDRSPWTFSTIGDELHLINGFGFKPHQWKESGTPIIRIQNLNDHEAPFDYVQHEVDERFLVKRGDLLFAWSGSRGTSFGPFIWSGGDSVLNQHIFNVRSKKARTERGFSYWWLKHLIGEIEQQAHGSAGLVHITRKELEKFRFPLLDVPEQRKIARILTALDNLIEKTEGLIAKYQAIKQGMMHDLFTRGVDECGQFRSCFAEAPNLYRESELGMVPKQWNVDRVSEHIDRIEQGWSPDCESEPASAGEWGILKTTAVVWDGFQEYENKRLPFTLAPLPQYEVHINDVLMTRGGPNSRVGVVAVVRETRDKLMISDKIYRLVPRNSISPIYLGLVLSSERTQTHLSTLKTGLAESQTNISQEIVRRLWIGIPDLAEQVRICDRIDAINNVIRTQRQTLAALSVEKSGLMQDLLTGKVRVRVEESGEANAYA